MGPSIDIVSLAVMIILCTSAGLWLGKVAAYIAAFVGLTIERVLAAVVDAADSVQRLQVQAADSAYRTMGKIMGGGYDDLFMAVVTATMAALAAHFFIACLHVYVAAREKGQEAMTVRRRR